MLCPYCGSDHVEYHGVDDGGGDYGNAVCDQYECLNCGNRFESDCLEAYDPGLEGVDRFYSAPAPGDPGEPDDLGDIPFLVLYTAIS